MNFRSFVLLLLPVAALAALSCVSTPTQPPATVNTNPVKVDTAPVTKVDTTQPQAQASRADDTGTLRELYKKGIDALDNTQTVEAIKAFISVLADFDMIASPSADAEKIKDQANLQLTKIGTGLFIEPAAEWIDKASGKQISGSTRSAGKSGALNPAVVLYENFGAGRLYVRGAGITFEFARNSGALTQLVTTDDDGKANSVLSKLDNPGKETVIRAYPFFRVKGYSYSFKAIARDFTYLPPSNSCIVITLEKSEFGASNNAQTADSVGTALKKAGFDVRPVNAVAAQATFLDAYAGSVPSVRKLAGEASISYIALVYLDCYQVKQVVYEGKAFNLFSAYVKPTMRLIREDGSILHTILLDGVKGDGSSKEAAVDNAYKVAREKLFAEIDKNRAAIVAAVEGK